MKKLIIIFCLCLSSLSFADNKQVSQAEIISILKGEAELLQCDNFIVTFGYRIKLAQYIDMLDSNTVTNDKYDNCIKDIIIEISVYKKAIHELEIMKKDNFYWLDTDIIQTCIDRLNSNVKIKIDELIEKLK